MPKDANIVDLWSLFQTGSSGGLVFKQTTPRTINDVIGEPDSDGEGPIPFSSWITEVDGFEFFFQGEPPRLYGLKMKPPGYAIGIGGGRPVERPVHEIKVDETTFMFRDLPWNDLLVLPTALSLIGKEADKIKATDDKMVVLEFEKDRRALSLTYALEPKQIEGGLYDFDYHFYALHMFDWAADAELSTTLPPNSGTRHSKLTEFAEALDKRVEELKSEPSSSSVALGARL